MAEIIAATETREVVARWESKGGAHWAELTAYRNPEGVVTGFGYTGKGCGGSLPCMDGYGERRLEVAVRALVEKDEPGFFRPDDSKTPMELVSVAGVPLPEFVDPDRETAVGSVYETFIHDRSGQHAGGLRLGGRMIRYAGSPHVTWKAWNGVVFVAGHVAGGLYSWDTVCKIQIAYVLATGRSFMEPHKEGV